MAQTRYAPFGQVRYQSGTLPTDKSFTGQRDEGVGLLNYNARLYDPYLGRFLSPDSLVPDPASPLDWDRYGYTRNNPIIYKDPTGNKYCLDEDCRITGAPNQIVPRGLSEKELSEIIIGLTPPPQVGPHADTISKWYDSIRYQLIKEYGLQYIDRRTGKMKDVALLDLIIMPEFGGMKGLDNKAYEAALAGLTSQYYSLLPPLQDGHAICFGSCSYKEQMLWLNDFSAIYLTSNPTINPLGNYFTDFVADGQRVIDLNVTQYPGGFWWTWGELIPHVGNGYVTFSLGFNVSYVLYPLPSRN